MTYTETIPHTEYERPQPRMLGVQYSLRIIGYSLELLAVIIALICVFTLIKCDENPVYLSLVARDNTFVQ